ncbi:hypothetical protein DL93DRAFT_1116671 [Clavulina sp. PMI_390]|nr:hypothetical protein DL93DRAFT_1116671 [Clavulina sp. PMI_390]
MEKNPPEHVDPFVGDVSGLRNPSTNILEMFNNEDTNGTARPEVTFQTRARNLFSTHRTHEYHKAILQGLEAAFCIPAKDRPENSRPQITTQLSDLSDTLPEAEEDEKEDDFVDGEGGVPEEIPEGFKFMDESKFITVPARFTAFRKVPGEYAHIQGRNLTYHEEALSYPLHLLLYCREAGPESEYFVRVSKDHYAKLADLEKRLIASQKPIDGSAADQILLDIYKNDWSCHDLNMNDDVSANALSRQLRYHGNSPGFGRRTGNWRIFEGFTKRGSLLPRALLIRLTIWSCSQLSSFIT